MTAIIEGREIAIRDRVHARRDATRPHSSRDASRQKIRLVAARERKAHVRRRRARLKKNARLQRVPGNHANVVLIKLATNVVATFDDGDVVPLFA